jgi:transcriptional regulator with XRE-family HTH domain
MVGSNLRRARIARGWTQQFVADALGVKRTRVTQWELGKGNPHGAMIRSVALLLGLELDDVIERAA